MEVIIWIVATIMMMVLYAIAEIRLNNLKSKHYDALHKNIDLETKVNALDKECQMYLDEAVEIAEEKNGIEKYANFLVKQYEELYQEKHKLEWQNERLREQVEFFERELAGEEFDTNALLDLPMDLIEDIQKRAFDIYCSAYKDKNNN